MLILEVIDESMHFVVRDDVIEPHDFGPLWHLFWGHIASRAPLLTLWLGLTQSEASSYGRSVELRPT